MTRHLVLIGASLAHAHLLAKLARQPVVGVHVTLVSPQTRLIHWPLVNGFVAGHCTLDDCAIPLEPLLQRSGARYVQQAVQALDPQARALLLADGSELAYDLLSLSPTMNEAGFAASRRTLDAAMPGAKHNALLTHPLEAFCDLWPRVTELAANRALRVAVICQSALQRQVPALAEFNPQAIELALAIRHRLPGSAVTLITGGNTPAQYATASLQTHISQALRDRNITVLMDSASTISPGEVTLGMGARLACDVPLVVNEGTVPHWMAESGLALDARGWVDVDARLHCTSHPGVFALPGDGNGFGFGFGFGHGSVNGSWAPPWAAERKAQALCRNLLAALAGRPLTPMKPGWSQLKLMSCADGLGIATWGERSWQGRWAGWLKRRIDHGVVARFKNTISPIESIRNNLKPSR